MTHVSNFSRLYESKYILCWSKTERRLGQTIRTLKINLHQCLFKETQVLSEMSDFFLFVYIRNDAVTLKQHRIAQGNVLQQQGEILINSVQACGWSFS